MNTRSFYVLYAVCCSAENVIVVRTLDTLCVSFVCPEAVISRRTRKEKLLVVLLDYISHFHRLCDNEELVEIATIEHLHKTLSARSSRSMRCE